MKNILATVVGSALALAAFARADMPAPQAVVTSDQNVVQVRDVVRESDGSVSGVVVNTSNRSLRDVQLMVEHEWLWNNEFHPGSDDPGRAVAFTVPAEIPPGGQVRFSTPPDPLPDRRDGYFRTRVDVLGATQIG